jgi:hypothetical protein
MSVDIRELRGLAHQLITLLDEPQTGLVSWHIAVGIVMKRLASYVPPQTSLMENHWLGMHRHPPKGQ